MFVLAMIQDAHGIRFDRFEVPAGFKYAQIREEVEKQIAKPGRLIDICYSSEAQRLCASSDFIWMQRILTWAVNQTAVPHIPV